MKSRPGRWLRFLFDPERLAAPPTHPRLAVEGLEERFLLTGGYTQVNLASDVPGLARVVDPNLVNPWGMSFSPTGPLWIANNGSGVSDVLDGRAQPIALKATVPSTGSAPGSPTGMVFNGGTGFLVSENGRSAPSRFLFATEEGTISGWSEVVDSSHALLEVDNSAAGADYTGLALASNQAGQSFLYAANVGQGTIDVFDAQFNPVVRSGAFQDPNLPTGYAPFNVQATAGELFVTYAKGAPRAGNGIIDVYDTAGSLLRRFASNGPLNLPWGMALAPADFGPYGGALLVGNTGDGTINAYDAANGAYRGQLQGTNNLPIAIPGLWSLTFGNGAEAGDSETLFFAAGIDRGQHGLFGALQSPERAGADTRGVGTYDPNAPGEPDDYPIPPIGGPSFPTVGDGSPATPTSLLLPASESSLALIPTLSPLPQSGRQIQASQSADAIVSASFTGTSGTPLATRGNSFTAPLAEQPRLPGSTQNDSLTLNKFLDLNTSLNRVPPGINPSERETGPDASERPSLAIAENAVRDEVVRSEPIASKVERSASAEQISEPSVSSDLAESLSVQVPSEGSLTPDTRLILEREATAIQDEGSWTTVLKSFLGVVSVSMVWSWLRGRGGNAPKLSREVTAVDLKTRRIERTV